MNEKQWTLSTDNTDWIHNSDLPSMPVLKIAFDGNITECHEHLSETSLVKGIPSTVDVTFRIQTGQEGLNVNGILGVANPRGEYIVECEAVGGQILEILKTANQYANMLHDIGHYELQIEANDGLVERWVEIALIVFTAENGILKEQSLIPPGLDI